ncbi:MAG: GTPase HflX [Pelosinus sp.]|nr:GTPase HflX [Pelosinus sp.]
MSEVFGDLKGLKKNLIARIEELYQVIVPSGQIITVELGQTMAEITAELNRELAVYLNRRGVVTAVAVGDTKTVSLPETKGRRNENRLSGIRCVHTHPNGLSQLSGVDISSLKEMRFDLMAALGVQEGKILEASVGFISGFIDDAFTVQTAGPLAFKDFVQIDLGYLTLQLDRELAQKDGLAALSQVERALLVGLDRHNGWPIADSLQELSQLAETAGAVVAGSVWQKKEQPDAALFIGRGKVQEISLMRQEQDVNLIIFDDELSPAQQRNLEQALGTKVIDRTALILDIFAQRARSHEGKLQVELAQLRYNLPRLGGQGLVLSRLGGGIGTRGPGETKLEVDRRRIRARISDIEHEIETVKNQRQLHRERRQTSRIPTVALVGYTNAGKSTLLNALTSAGVLAEDKLFATLDPTTRRIELSSGQDFLLTDTVGFIQKIPHNLIAAFRATLEEVVHADLLLHVVDASHHKWLEQSEAVFKVLHELKADEKPTITAFNKIDKIDNTHVVERLLRTENSVGISAQTEQGLDQLLAAIEGALKARTIDICLLVPYNDNGVIAQIYDIAAVISTEYQETGTLLQVSIPPEFRQKFSCYIVGDE